MSSILINTVITTVLCAGIALFFILKTKRIKRGYGEKLKEHNEPDMLSLVASKTDNYVMITDKEDNIEWVNEGFTRLTGYTHEEVIGKKPPDVLRGEFTDSEAAERVNKKAKDKKPYSAEILNYNKKGEPIWMFLNVTPILNDKGEIIRYITVGSDITERKEEEEELIRQKEQIEKKYNKMWKTSLAVHKQKEDFEKLNAELNEQKEKLEQAYKHLSAKNSKLWRTSLLVNKHKEEAEKTKAQLEKNNQEITDSIQYAKIIQQAILPRVSEIQKFLPNMFILYKPKDIVSGDFYWITEAPLSIRSNRDTPKHRKPLLDGESSTAVGREVIIAVCDCTGHGVPGAYMSMIGNDLLNNAIIEKGITEPAAILDRLQIGIRFTLQQDRADSKAHDGMDMALISLKFAQGDSIATLQYAGANNPIYIIRKGAKSSEIYKEAIPFGEGLEGAVIKADRQPVGVYGTTVKPFTNHIIELQKGDILYLFSDGYQDQFGGPKEKKFKSTQVRKLLLSIHGKSMEEQKEILEHTFLNWRGELDQIDDILVIGIRV